MKISKNLGNATRVFAQTFNCCFYEDKFFIRVYESENAVFNIYTPLRCTYDAL